MSRFIQLHLLTSYPPANLNRDDLGRPKTAKMGGVDRLRVSSQSLKRAWRTSEIFAKKISKGVRTKMIGIDAFSKLSEFPALSQTERRDIAKNIAQVFGKLKEDSMELETLAFVSNKEQENVNKVIAKFDGGLRGATVETNSLGVKIFEVLIEDIRTPINELLNIIKKGNDTASLKENWDKPKGLKDIFKKYIRAEDKNQFDYIIRMIDNSDDWLTDVTGTVEVGDDQIEMLLANDSLKLTKEILKKLSMGSLLSGQIAKKITYGELKHKEHIGLCNGWEEQINTWVEGVKKSEDEDFLSEENIEKLKLAVSPVAIAKSAILTNEDTNADIALFGRMLASSVNFNVEAACQVAHAISVHPVVIEDDYFTAVEELNKYKDDAGAAHIGETGFAAGLFYSYICINRDLLVENLGGDEDLAKRAIAALTESAVKVSPNGKQNSFASRAYASYVLAEKGEQQPRSLSVAFLKPIDNRTLYRDEQDFGTAAVEALEAHRQNMNKVYGDCADEVYAINALTGDGTMTDLLDFVIA